MKLLSAITAATVKATVVKNPKTFCNRTSAECILSAVWVVRKLGCSRGDFEVVLTRMELARSPVGGQPYGAS